MGIFVDRSARVHPYKFQTFLYLYLYLYLRPFFYKQRLPDYPPYHHPGIQGTVRVLEHYVPLSFNRKRSMIRLKDTGYHPGDRGFSAARLAHKAESPAFFDGKTHPVNGLNDRGVRGEEPFAFIEVLRQVCGFENSIHNSFVLARELISS